MVERHAIGTLMRTSAGEAAILLVTFGLTIFRVLTEAIVVGFALGSVLFIYRMSQTTAIETDTPFVPEDVADNPPKAGVNGGRSATETSLSTASPARFLRGRRSYRVPF